MRRNCIGIWAYCVNSRSEENFIRNTSIFGAWNTAYSLEYVECGWNTAEYRPLGGHLEYVENVFTDSGFVLLLRRKYPRRPARRALRGLENTTPLSLFSQ